MVEAIFGAIGDAVVSMGAPLVGLIPAISKFVVIDEGDVSYVSGDWDTAADNTFDYHDLDIVAETINEMLWNKHLGLYIKRGYVNKLAINGLSLADIRIQDLAIELDGVYLTLGVLSQCADQKTKDQYIVWKAKKIEEDPDFFKKGSSIFMEEVAQLTKMAGSEPKAAGISKAGEFSIASLLPALLNEVVQWLIPHLGSLREFMKTDLKVSNINLRIEIASPDTPTTGFIKSRGVFWEGEVFTLNEPVGTEIAKFGIPQLQEQQAYAKHSLAKSIAICTPSVYVESKTTPVDLSSGPLMMAALNNLRETNSDGHVTLFGRARIELAFLLKLTGLKPTDLVNMNVSKFIESLAIKMIGIGTSGNLNISYNPETIDLLLEWAQQKLFEHPTGAIPAGNRGNSVLMTNLPAVDIRIMRLDALEFYLYNFLFMPSAPTDGTGIDLGVLTKGLIGWKPSCLIEILTPPAQPAKNFCLNAPESGEILPYLTVRAGREATGKTLKYAELGAHGKLGIRIETYTDFGSRFSHYVADTHVDGPAKFLKNRNLAYINEKSTSAYDHDALISLLKSTPKPLKVGYYA